MILIADDVELNRKFLTAACEAHGYRTREVANGQEAIDAASRERFEFILMDVMMPIVDGLEATRRIRALPVPTSRARIIGMTALERGTLDPEGWLAGMNAVLYKPFGVAQLRQLLRQCSGCPIQDCGVVAR